MSITKVWESCTYSTIHELYKISELSQPQNRTLNEMIKFIRDKWNELIYTNREKIGKLKLGKLDINLEYLFKVAYAIADKPYSSKEFKQVQVGQQDLLSMDKNAWFEVMTKYYPQLADFSSDLANEYMKSTHLEPQRITELSLTPSGWGHMLAFDEELVPSCIIELYIARPDLFIGKPKDYSNPLEKYQNAMFDNSKIRKVSRAFLRASYLKNRLNLDTPLEVLVNIQLGLDNTNSYITYDNRVNIHIVDIEEKYTVQHTPCGLLYLSSEFVDLTKYTRAILTNFRLWYSNSEMKPRDNASETFNRFLAPFFPQQYDWKTLEQTTIKKDLKTRPFLFAGFRSRLFKETGSIGEIVDNNFELIEDQIEIPPLYEEFMEGVEHIYHPNPLLIMTNPTGEFFLINPVRNGIIHGSIAYTGDTTEWVGITEQLLALKSPSVVNYFKRFHRIDPMEFALMTEWGPMIDHISSYLCAMRGFSKGEGMDGGIGGCLAAVIFDAGGLGENEDKANPIHPELVELIVGCLKNRHLAKYYMLQHIFMYDKYPDVKYLDDEGVRIILDRGYISPLPLIGKRVADAKMYERLSTDYKLPIIMALYGLNNPLDRPHFIVDKQENVIHPIERYILKSSSIDDLINRLKIKVPAKSKLDYMIENIQSYNYLSWEIEIDMSDLSKYLIYFTDKEILNKIINARIGYTSREELISVSKSLLDGKSTFFIPNERHCTNELTIDINETNNTKILIIAYGTLDKHDCYTITDIIDSFSVDVEKGRFNLPGYEKEYHHPKDEEVTQLINLLQIAKPYVPKGYVRAFDKLFGIIKTVRKYSKIVVGIDIAIKELFIKLSAEDSEYLHTLMVKIFEAGMYMRQWKGPGHPYPYTEVDSRKMGNDKIGVPHAEKSTAEMGYLYNESPPGVRKIVDSMLINNRYNKKDIKIGDSLSSWLIGVCTGTHCIRMSSSRLVTTISHYLDILYNEEIENFDPSKMDLLV